MSDALRRDKDKLERQLARYVSRGVSDLRDAQPPFDWLLRHPEVSEEDLAEQDVIAYVQREGAFVALGRKLRVCRLVGVFEADAQWSRMSLTLSSLYKTLSVVQTAGDATALKRHFAAHGACLRSNLEAARAGKVPGWGCCRIDLHALVCAQGCDRSDPERDAAQLLDFADAMEGHLGAACHGWREARELAQQATLRAPERPAKPAALRQPPLRRRSPPPPPPRVPPPVREPGAGLSDELRARVDDLVARVAAGQPLPDLDTEATGIGAARSTPERLWRLGGYLRAAYPGQDGLLAAERAWCAAQALPFDRGTARRDERHYVGRCASDAAALQPQVDPAGLDPDAMLRLIAVAQGAGLDAVGDLRAIAEERAAEARGWNDRGDADGARDDGLPHALAAASGGRLPMMTLLVEDALDTGDRGVPSKTVFALAEEAHGKGAPRVSRALARAMERGHAFPSGGAIRQDPLMAAHLHRAAFLQDLPAAQRGDRGAMLRVADAYWGSTWVPPEAVHLGAAWAADPTLQAWNGDFVGRGARHAMPWLLRAAGSGAPFSERPCPEDIPQPPDAVAQAALCRAARLLQAGLGVPAQPEAAQALLSLAAEAGSAAAQRELGLLRWRAWPLYPFDAPEGLTEDQQDPALHEICGLLGRAADAGDAGAAVWHSHLSGLEDPGAGPDRLLPPPDEALLAAYARASAAGASPVPPHIALAVMARGSGTEAARIRAAWDLARRARGGQASAAMNRLFGEALEALLAFDPVSAGLFASVAEPPRSAITALMAAPRAVHDWLTRQRAVPRVVCDWLELRAQFASAIAEPGASAWARAVARAQLRTVHFGAAHRLLGQVPTDIGAIEDRIARSTADVGPLWLAADERGYPLPGARVPMARLGLLRHLRRQVGPTRIGRVMRVRPDPHPDQPGALPAPAYAAISQVTVRPDAAPWSALLQVTGTRDDAEGRVSRADILDCLALAVLHDGDASLSLEPLVQPEASVLGWRISRRSFTPDWLGATDLGRTMFIADHLLFYAGHELAGFARPLLPADALRRVPIPQPWRRMAEALGSAAYMSGVGQLTLAARHRPDGPAAQGWPRIVPISKVSAMIRGGGWSLPPAGGAPQRFADEHYVRNHYKRTALLASAGYAEMCQVFPLFDRAARLQGIYADLCEAFRPGGIPAGSRLHRLLTRRVAQYQRAWDRRKWIERQAGSSAGDDLIWS